MPKKPNIILINVDDLGYEDIGCYGSQVNDTPALDQMAKDGMRFTDFYAPAAVCTPSRAGMLTGCYPKRIDFMDFDVYDPHTGQRRDSFVVLMPGQPQGLHPQELTLAQVLRRAGYATQMIGKWHVGDQPAFFPTRFGFDHYLGIPYSNDMGLQQAQGVLKELEYTLCPLPLVQDEEVIAQQPEQAALTETYAREACRFIRQNRQQPFFLYLAHMYVHHPLFVPQRFKEQSRNGLMGAAVAAVDWCLSMIDHELKRQNLWEDTLVIFTSDNGGDLRSSNKPLRGHKGSSWEGGFRVNCLMRWPRGIASGLTCGEICTMMDFLPTFAELSQVSLEDGVKRDGYSLLPLWEHPQAFRSPYEAFYYYCSNRLEAVRSGQYKLHLVSRALYHLGKDIGETTDIAADHPDVVSKLRSLAEKARRELGDGASPGNACRPKGFVTPFQTMTAYDPTHPYLVASYDLDS